MTKFYLKDNKVVIDDSGQLGIGTLIPGNIVDIVNSTQCGIDLTVYYSGATNTAFTQKVARNVISAPQAVQNNDRLMGLFGAGYSGPTNGFIDASAMFGEVDGTPSPSSMPSRLTFYTTPSGSLIRAERMRITNSGYVGIGTNSPNHSLIVNNTTMTTSDTVTSFLTPNLSNGARVVALVGKAETTNNSSFIGHIPAATANQSLTTFGQWGANELMVIRGDGAVGIGVTAPLARLHSDVGTGGVATMAGLIYGSTNVGTFTYPGVTPNKNTATLVVGSNWGTSSGAVLNVFSAAVDGIIYARADGYVGIDNTSPLLNLDVRGSSWVQGHFQSTTTTYSGGIELWSGDATSKYEIQASAATANPGGAFFIFDRTDNRYAFTIDTNGRIGIGSGNTSPSMNFHLKEASTGTVGTIIQNTTSGTAAYTTLRLYNDQNSPSRSLEIDYASSGYTGSLLGSGPTGESASIGTTGNYPLVFGTTNTARWHITGGGDLVCSVDHAHNLGSSTNRIGSVYIDGWYFIYSSATTYNYFKPDISGWGGLVLGSYSSTNGTGEILINANCMRVPVSYGNPAAATIDGLLWYDANIPAFRVRVNGVIKTLIS